MCGNVELIWIKLWLRICCPHSVTEGYFERQSFGFVSLSLVWVVGLLISWLYTLVHSSRWRAINRPFWAPSVGDIGSNLPYDPFPHKVPSVCYRVDWALLPLSTSKSGQLSVAGNCLLYHQPLLPATKGPQQTSLLSDPRVHTRCLHRWQISAFSIYKGAVLFVEISQSAHNSICASTWRDELSCRRTSLIPPFGSPMHARSPLPGKHTTGEWLYFTSLRHPVLRWDEGSIYWPAGMDGGICSKQVSMAPSA